MAQINQEWLGNFQIIYYFTVQVTGRGKTPSEAWRNAKSENDLSGSMPQEYTSEPEDDEEINPND